MSIIYIITAYSGLRSQFEGYPLPSYHKLAFSFSRCAPAATDPKSYLCITLRRSCGRV